MLTATSQTAEAAEGISAFIEKRPPMWQADGPRGRQGRAAGGR
jgi:hypothetical protein